MIVVVDVVLDVDGDGDVVVALGVDGRSDHGPVHVRAHVDAPWTST